MLPSYTIRESHRAKHVSLKISLVGSLEVVIPQGFDRDHIPTILQQKQRWINQVTQRVEAQQALAGFEASDKLPETIGLQAINETWTVEYCSTPLPAVRAIEHRNFNLVIYGNTADQLACKTSLQRWVANKARVHLAPWLRAVSQDIKLPFTQVSVRGQKTRWGSCSGRKAISLNCKLLFLPSPLVHYVLVHELCHTVHLNHSADFWTLVKQFEPNYQHLDAELQEARYYVPLWMEETHKGN